MNIKKVLALFCAVAILWMTAGCKSAQENVSSQISETQKTEEYRNYITLLYSAADTFNPYTAKTDTDKYAVCYMSRLLNWTTNSTRFTALHKML